MQQTEMELARQVGPGLLAASSLCPITARAAKWPARTPWPAPGTVGGKPAKRIIPWFSRTPRPSKTCPLETHGKSLYSRLGTHDAASLESSQPLDQRCPHLTCDLPSRVTRRRRLGIRKILRDLSGKGVTVFPVA